MAAAVVGEALISASVEILLGRMASREFRDFCANRKLNVSLLDELEIKLLALNAVLNDAEEKQITNLAVKEWLDKLKDAVLDAEDLLDEINTRSLRRSVKGNSQNMATQVRSILYSPFKQFYRRMNSKLEEISRRLEYFVKQKDILGLQSIAGRAFNRTKTSSLVNESVVIAREDDKEKLLNMLLSDDDVKPNNIGVITILGMGGLGKTTLAQLLYHDSEVQKQFDLKAWACVSDDFDVFMVTKNLYESINAKVYNSNNLDFLRVELKNCFKDKKILIVLDDLWNEKYNDWDQLITPFSTGKRGSKIIVTTRQQRVAEVTRTLPIYELKPLSDENCWCILAKHAFGNEGYGKYPILEEIGRKIARKCCGLPIAAKTLGGLLRSKADAKEWNRIWNSNIWDLPHDDVLPALRISYLHLPAHLKRCFAYCSIFPKQRLLDRKELILLWMAEGFLQQSRGEKAMELEGDDCFDELVSRSLIQRHQGDPEEKYGMHGLIYDLARVVSGKSWCCFEGNQIPQSVRHLSFLSANYVGFKTFKIFSELKCLRTFLPCIQQESYGKYDRFENLKSFDELKCLRTFLPQCLSPLDCYLNRKVSHDLLPKLRCLRVLSFSGYQNFAELPNSIGSLVHLRYLDLSNTSVKRLPNAAFTLYNLQTMILSNCKLLIELPEQIGNLVSLRHLDVSGTNLVEMPTQICKLQNLRGLTAFVVGKQDGLRVRELRKFPYLQGKLSILKLQNVVDPIDASEADLQNKEQIEELVLDWGSNTQDSRVEKDVLDKLQPSTYLRKLIIGHYGGISFPNWMGDSSFSNIKFLSISDCNFCAALPSLGQLPSLKELFITRIKMVHKIGQEFYCSNVGSSLPQPFPSLECLEFKEMSDWVEWQTYMGQSSKFPFPCLKRLCLLKCPKLRGNLPNRLPSMTEICILECNQLEAESSDLRWNTSIQFLSIEKCDSLMSLPRMILGGNCLQYLCLKNISSLISFPSDGLPTSLRRLAIACCGKLGFLSNETWHKYTSLEYLHIWNSCHSLTSFPLGSFPDLELLSIRDCPNLESITQGGESAPSLLTFEVRSCKKLKSLPEQIDVSALKDLTLSMLPEVASLPRSCLPSNLQVLDVDCRILSCMAKSELGFHFQRLTSLSILYLRDDGDGDLVNTLLKEQLLPTSLFHLGLLNLGGIELLDGKGLQLLTSLQKLYIYDCPSLESLPEDQLPSSLVVLNMKGCPLLEARYQRQKGKRWSKIAHIPAIKINGELIV